MEKINILNVRNKYEWEHVMDLRTMAINDPRIDASFDIYQRTDKLFVIHSRRLKKTFALFDMETALKEIKK